MAASDPELWARLKGFCVGEDGAAFGFEDRLARENGWSAAFAHRVMEEYRRFIYLCMVAGHPMTPSDQVDQAWHLHLAYTRSYWHDLCRDRLRRPLHHEPTRGGAAARARFREHYQATLDAYQHEFATPPPADVWPDVEARFGGFADHRRIDTATHWVIDKDRFAKRLWRVLALLLTPSALAACTLLEATEDGWHLTTEGVWVVFVLVGLPVAVAAQLSFLNPRRRRGSRGGDGCGGLTIGCDDGGCSGCGGCGGCSD